MKNLACSTNPNDSKKTKNLACSTGLYDVKKMKNLACPITSVPTNVIRRCSAMAGGQRLS